jgi:hypothetical protein
VNATGRRVRALAVAALASLSMAAATAADRSDWLILERVGADKPETLTVARELPSLPARAKFPVLVEVIWGYKALPNGMPADGELPLGARFHEALDGIFGTGGVHVMTRTGESQRTMYYYVDNPDRHADALKKFFDALPPLKLEIRARDEPDWDTVREVREAIK